MIIRADRIRETNWNTMMAEDSPCTIARGGLAVPLPRFTMWILSALFAQPSKTVRITEQRNEWKGDLKIPSNFAVI